HPVASARFDGQDGGEMPQAGDDSEESLSLEATTRVWQDPARERDPVTGHPDILESPAPAERTDLAPGQEVVRGPVASIRTEGGRTVVGEVRLEEADRAARVVVRFHEEEAAARPDHGAERDRKSTRLNSSHVAISYAVFCLK